MSVSRRSLLWCAGTGCALTLMPPVLHAATALRRYQVRDTVALPRFAPGDVVIADTTLAGFSGPGLYLYPAWGEPRLYEVHASKGHLEFRNPGSRELLWTQSAGFDAAFAGKVLEGSRAAHLLADMPPLSVPGAPITS